MMLPRTNNSKCQTNLRIVGTILLIVWFILWAVLFITGTTPQKNLYYEAPSFVQGEGTLTAGPSASEIALSGGN
jgi:hypothetical protein